MVLLDKFIFIHGWIGIKFVSHIVNIKTAESKHQKFGSTEKQAQAVDAGLISEIRAPYHHE